MEDCRGSIGAAAFLEKLYEILENDSHSDIISWQPDGASFLIKKVNDFSDSVLPRYFKHNNIQSFVRQLNMYSFSKTRHDSNFREFKHSLFQKGRRDLLPSIKRKNQITSIASTKSQSSNEINSNRPSNGLPLHRTTSITDDDKTERYSEIEDDDERANLSIELNEVKDQVKILEARMARMSDMYHDMFGRHESLRRAFEESQMRSAAPDAVDPVTSLLDLKRRREPATDAADEGSRSHPSARIPLASHLESAALPRPHPHPALVAYPEAHCELIQPVKPLASGGLLVRMISLDPSTTQTAQHLTYTRSYSLAALSNGNIGGSSHLSSSSTATTVESGACSYKQESCEDGLKPEPRKPAPFVGNADLGSASPISVGHVQSVPNVTPDFISQAATSASLGSGGLDVIASAVAMRSFLL